MVDILLTYTPETRDLKFGARALAGLRELGRLQLYEGAEPMTTAELIEAAKGFPIIVSDRLTPGEAALFDGRPELVAFLRCAMDIRNIDIGAASQAGVLVSRAGPGFLHGVVEMLVAQIVDLARGLSGYVMAYRGGHVPAGRQGLQLFGRTVGIIGFGNLGRRLAEILHLMGMRVLVHDPYAAEVPAGYERVERADLLGRADFVVCLAVHTPETTRMVDEAFLKAMRKDAFLLNPSRGPVVDEDALERALKEGWIAGAALDVGSLPDDIPPLRLGSLPNVIAAPHVGGLVPEAIESQAMDTVDAVRGILAGETPRYALNAPHATRLKQGLPR